MATLTLQLAVALLVLGFSALAWRAGARATGGEPPRRDAWRLAGVAYMVSGLLSLAQSVLAVPAFFYGEGSPLWNFFLLVSPIGNHARSGLQLAFTIFLLWVALRSGGLNRRDWNRAGAILLLGLLLGVGVGVAEGSWNPARHYLTGAAADGLLVLGLVAVLMAGFFRGTLDQIFWTVFTVHMVYLALKSLVFAASAWLAVPGMWSPSPIVTQLSATITWAVMCALAGYRLHLARRGAYVPAPFEFRPFSTSTYR
ncbi:MAG: hypothetical protein ACREKN_07515 [Longimicrobiaceae bacterium]